MLQSKPKHRISTYLFRLYHVHAKSAIGGVDNFMHRGTCVCTHYVIVSYHIIMNKTYRPLSGKVQRALKMGILTKTPCEKCKSNILVDGHHDDYDKPLKVRWLCRKCHRKHHVSLMQPKSTDVNIRISRKTYKKLKVRATMLGVTLKEYIERLTKPYLNS